MNNLKYYQLESFSGTVELNVANEYWLLSECGKKFLIKGDHSELQGDHVTITGLGVFGIRAINEIYVQNIQKTLK